MSDVATLLSEFLDELNAGGAPEATSFLARAENDEQRVELAEGIETVLAFAPDQSRQPRDQDGGFVLGISANRIAAAAASPWSETIPFWRDQAALTIDQLAEAALRNGGVETSEQNVSAAARWIGAMESGAETARTISSRAMDAISDALGVARDKFAAAGAAEPHGAVAFRATDDLAASGVAEDLEIVAFKLANAMPSSPADSEVDGWFSSDG
jgi:hypothetical protein